MTRLCNSADLAEGEVVQVDLGDGRVLAVCRWQGTAFAIDDLCSHGDASLAEGEIDGVPMFVLSHPAMVGPDGDLTLFTDIAVGDQVMLMRGSPESLVKRAAAVVDDACGAGGWARGETEGGLVIYCGGCMLHVRDRMGEVAEQIGKAMHGAPFLGAFTFGEQGAIVDSSNRHGNLMVSGLMFGR